MALPGHRIGLFLLALALFPAPGAATVACAGGEAMTASATEREHSLICSGVAAALDFFAACGMEPGGTIHVEVGPDMPEVCGAPAHAAYRPAYGRLEVASLDACLGSGAPSGLFALVESGQAYRSIVAHEATHAILTRLGLGPNRIAAHEYLASVVQIELLPPEAQRALTGTFSESRHIEPAKINILIYGMAPLFFAAKSHFHFHQQTDGCSLVAAIVSGSARFETMR